MEWSGVGRPRAGFGFFIEDMRNNSCHNANSGIGLGDTPKLKTKAEMLFLFVPERSTIAFVGEVLTALLL